ncbi:hypothetical protein CDL24_11145 [Mediterraneibacter gnavus]|nr:hypothetical protein CDL24_11145 [Mediterraneibacter gnavus]
MTRAEARNRQRRKRRMQYVLAWTAVFLFEILIAAAPTAIVAAFLIPITYAERGRIAVGGEWLAIMIVFCFAYRVIHGWVCDRIYGEEA